MGLTDIQLAIVAVAICSIILILHWLVAPPLPSHTTTPAAMLTESALRPTIAALSSTATSPSQSHNVPVKLTVSDANDCIASTTNIPHTATVIWVHGLGDTGRGWLTFAHNVQQQLPYIKFVLPTAPIGAVTINGGRLMRSWHDFKNFTRLDVRDFTGVDDSLRQLSAIIKSEIDSGVSSDRIVIGGFSQGGGMATLTGLSFPQSLAGIVCLSGYLINRSQSFDVSNAVTPVFVGHGTSDPTIPIIAALQLKQVLSDGKRPVEFREYAGVRHTVSEQGQRDVIHFIQQRLPTMRN